MRATTTNDGNESNDGAAPASAKRKSVTRSKLNIQTLAQLAKSSPSAEPEVVRGLLQTCDVANIIAPSKLGKSYFVAQLVVSYVAEIDWLGFTFGDAPRRVLLIDNEIKPYDIHRRLRYVAEAMGVDYKSIESRVDVLSLRGGQLAIDDIIAGLSHVTPRTYGLVVLDAIYRLLGKINENSNSDMSGFYNRLEAFAGRIQSAVCGVHHASKGDQSEKAVTDVGSGAGSISRAVDCHLILRPHEETDCYVIDFALRNFKCPESIVVRRVWPLWIVEPSLSPRKLRTANQKPKPTFDDLREVLAAGDDSTVDHRHLIDGLRAKGFANAAIRSLLEHEEAADRIRRIPGPNRTYAFFLTPAKENDA